MITLDSISKKFAASTLFEDVTISFNPGCRYGLTGPNGAGKSTLLKLMIGQEPANSGHVTLPDKVGYLKQDIAQFKEYTPIETVLMGNPRLWNALVEKEKLYEKPMDEAVGMQLAEKEEIIAEENGYLAESDAEQLLDGLGIPSNFHEMQMQQLPTDWQFRVLLCQALFGNPPALLLDEPTNHLDLHSISWLENFLKSYQGTLIVISHNRHFLNTITTHIADIDYETIIIYPGNYDQMVNAKTQMRERTEDESKSKEKKIAQLKEFVSRFGAGTRASQVQSRIKEIKKLEPEELKKSNIQKPYIRFPNPTLNSGKIPIKAVDIAKHFGDKVIIKNFSFEASVDDKIAIIGNNGKGKTTLIKLLTKLLDLDRGEVVYGHQVNIGYFPQEHLDIVDKTKEMSLFDWLKDKNNNVYDQDVRSVLGQMLFAKKDAFKSIKALSGGETARLILCDLMLKAPNVLILDEPNNHLDLEAVSALGEAIHHFKGTAIVSGHDRDFINAFSNKVISFEEDEIRFYNGSLEEYLKKYE